MARLALGTAQRHQHWIVSKRAKSSQRGVVTAASAPAAEIGARILRAGGNAVDAAVATALALHVTEPWSSGLGGGGFMLVYEAAARKVHAIDFSMKAAADVDPARYPVVPGAKRIGAFQWPEVLENRNLVGWDSILIPGAVDGFGVAIERFGRLSWAEVLAPVIELAERGLPVGWYTTLAIACEAQDLARFPGSREVFLKGGHYPLTIEGDDGPDVMRNPKTPDLLRRLAAEGPRDFYEGGIARDIEAAMNAGGRAWNAADLAAYRAGVAAPIEQDHRGHRLHAVPGLNGGPTVLRFFEHYATEPAPAAGAPGPAAYAALARNLRARWQERYATMGDTSPQERCTTHVNVADRDGNLVSLTNTMGARFGSKVMLESIGLLMNNGMFWFDPLPGHPNSIGPGKFPLTNACPLMVSRGGEVWLAIGASGGRRVPPTIIQLVSFLIDHGLSLEDAFHVPRIDPVRLEAVTCDHRVPPEAVATIAAEFPVRITENAAYPMVFAVPGAIARDLDSGRNTGMVSIDVPFTTTISEDEIEG